MDALDLRFHVFTDALYLRLFGLSDVRGEHVEFTPLHFIDVARHDLLGLLIDVPARLNVLDSLLAAFLGVGERLLRLGLGLLLLLRALFDERAGLGLNAFERAVAEPAVCVSL